MRHFRTIATCLFFLICGVAGAQVATAWVARYDGPGHLDNGGAAIVVDAEGNAYVAGTTRNANGLSDYLTAKYDPMGNLLWAAIYDGPAHGVDVADAIALDPSGNAYVTGESDGLDGHQDCLTIKYDTNGNQMWVARYSAGNFDLGREVALDPAGNVVVMAECVLVTGEGQYETIKFDASGNLLWVRRYSQQPDKSADPAGLAVDAFGNIYITGTSDVAREQTEYSTVKYDPNGTRLWVAHYHGTGNYYDGATALTVDSAGNAYVTGASWSVGSNRPDCATIKYDTNGNQVWSARYVGPGGLGAFGHAVTLDPAGNVYVASSYFDAAKEHFATLKYDPNGNQLWVALYEGPQHDDDRPDVIAVDPAGSVYVAGQSLGPNGSDYAAVKYDSSGNQLWLARYNAWTPNWGSPYKLMAVDPGGNVYITGYTSPHGAFGKDCITFKYVPAVGPTGFSLPLGRLVSGGLDELQNPDDRYVVAQNDPFSGQNAVQLVVTGTSPVWSPTNLTITLEARGSTLRLVHTIELWDYYAQAYVVVDVRQEFTFDATAEIPTTNPQRFVDPLTHQIRTRCTWVPSQPLAALMWQINVDQFAWIIG